jgi:hypothetical protein
MRLFRRRSEPRPDQGLDWRVVGDRRHIFATNPLTSQPEAFCGASRTASAGVAVDASAAGLDECDDCWEQLEFLRWA